VEGELVLTTDSSVVSPLFFPGGDIGKLAVHGGINDLAVTGAEPMYLSLALILEEGLPLEILRRVIASVAEAARACRVVVVTGDTKVVPAGAADQLFLSVTAVGRRLPEANLGADRIRVGDRILISGTLGDHGLAILTAREQLQLDPPLQSDSAPLHDLIRSLLQCGAEVHWMRDPTRGGLSAALHEVCEASGLSVVLEETALPLRPAVRGACEILGLDPLYIANEGKLVGIVAESSAERALECLRGHPQGRDAALVGAVVEQKRAQVLVRGPLGALRILDEPTGAPLPRIC
jgi:hydrogenase expression/formation protein HypE